MKSILPFIMLLSFFFIQQEGYTQTINNDPEYLEQGKELYRSYCATCHGKRGGLGLLGATNLKKSTMETEVTKQLIISGNGKMTPFKDILTKEQVNMIARYVIELRK